MPGPCYSREVYHSFKSRITKPIFYSVIIFVLGYFLTHGVPNSNESCDPINEIDKTLKRLEEDNSNLIRQVNELDLNRLQTERVLLNIRDELNRLSVFQDQMVFDLNQVNINMENNQKANHLTKEEVNELIDKKIEIFAADKTGLADFALESLGASIVSTRDTKNFPEEPTSKTLFDIGNYQCPSQKHNPSHIIQASSLPGECWAFIGQEGSAVIRLVGKVFIRGITLEHIPRRLAPSGELSSAPKEFSLWGLKNEDDFGEFLGRFNYLINIDKPLQYFMINQENTKSFCFIMFMVHSNHGHPDYTCVYRLRVHGLRDASLTFPTK